MRALYCRFTEMENLCERLLAIMETNKEDLLARLRADQKAWLEEIRSVLFETSNTSKETMAYRESMEARPEEEKPASVDTKPAAAQAEEVPIAMPVREPEEETMSITLKKTMACQEMEERLEEGEPTSVDRKPEVAQQQEVPNKDAIMKPVKGRKKRYRGRKQAVGRRGEPKELTRGILDPG
jgi:hypothetical protein